MPPLEIIIMDNKYIIFDFADSISLIANFTLYFAPVFSNSPEAFEDKEILKSLSREIANDNVELATEFVNLIDATRKLLDQRLKQNRQKKIDAEIKRQKEEEEKQKKEEEKNLLVNAYEKYKQKKLEQVYVFHLYSNIYKIGRSGNAERRLSEWISYCKSISNNYNYDNFSVIHTIETYDNCWLEQHLHKVYADKRIKDHELSTELFALDISDLVDIGSVHKAQPSWYYLVEYYEKNNQD